VTIILLNKRDSLIEDAFIERIILALHDFHLKCLQNVSDEILGTDVEVFGDLMLDVAEAYMAQQEYQESLNFLEKLVNSENWAKVKQKVLLGFFFNFQAMFWYFRTCY